MGQPMALALLRAGFDVVGFDVRAPSEMGEMALHMRGDQEFAAEIKTLITVVRDAKQTDDVLFGAQNFTAIAPNLQTIIISSTLSPRYVRDLRNRVPEHIALIDAPMSGAAVAAKEARLSFMLGGAPDDLAQAKPIFLAMGKHLHVMGPFGSGMAAKVLNNLAAASSTAITRLALDWADALGVDEGKLLALMHDSSGQTWFGSNFDQIEFARDGLEPDNTISILVKDVEAAIDGAPQGADTDLPEALIRAISKLRPRDT